MADRYFVAGGVDTNWGTTGNWALTSGGAGGQAVPLSTDDVFLDGNSPSCTLNTSARVAKSLTCTGYTNTLTFSQTLTVSGNVTIVAAMTLAGASALLINATSTITTNGKAITIPVTLNGNVTYTLADNWNMDALLTIGLSTTATVNGNTINVGGSLTTVGLIITGTTAIVFDGTGTLTTAANLNNTGGKTINTAGTLTLSGNVRVGHSLTYTAGTVTVTSSTLQIANLNTALAIGGITLNNFEVASASNTSNFNSILTLNEDVNVAGNFVFSTSSLGAINGNQIFVSGNLSGPNNSSAMTGTTEIVMAGTGSLSWAGHLKCPLTIDTAGTVTISGTISINGGPFTYTSGTVAGTSTPTVQVTSFAGASTTTTFDLDDLTLPASLSVIRPGAGAVTLALASGMTIPTGQTVRLTGTSGSLLSAINSTSGGTQRAFTLQSGVITNIRYNTATDMDSSGGQTVIWRKPGSITNTTNWGETAGGGNGHGNGNGGGGVTQFSPAGARFFNIGNTGLSVYGNS